MGIGQKLGIGAFLTVNLLLIIIALVRVTMYKRGNTYDLTWTLFFQIFEPNVAILAACFTAFRSLFVIKSSKRRLWQNRPSTPFRERLFKNEPANERPLENLPSVPGPTLRGIRTMIWRDNNSYVAGSDFNESNLNYSIANPALDAHLGDVSSLEGVGENRDKIVVRHDLSFESTRVRDMLSRRRMAFVDFS